GFTFNDDLTDVQSIADDGYLRLRIWSLFVPYTIEIRAQGGRVVHEYSVAGMPLPYDDEARRWLARKLPSVVRQLALGASDRTRQILAGRGTTGLLDEIAKLESDYARGVYFRELHEAVKEKATDGSRASGAVAFDSQLIARVVTLAADIMRSDFELSRTLRAFAPDAA